jgi:hypothetical protein
MGYCADYEHDIFLSYSTEDNSEDWVLRFLESLRKEMARRLRSERLRFWHDVDRMRGGGLIDPELAEAVNNSAVMVSLISRAYLKSKYCINDELFGFYNKAIEEEGVGFSVNNQSRIFPIFIDNLDPEKTEAYLPKGLRGVRRFAFHEQGRAPGLVAKPLAASDPAYEAAMENLCDQLERLLNFFPHDARNEPQQSPPQHIFLAAVDESLKRIRDDFRRELEEGDLVLVHEDVPPPPERHGHDKAARSALKNSRISVHMLSGHRGDPVQPVLHLSAAAGRTRIGKPEKTDLLGGPGCGYR